jgi:hypothetical protein
MIDSTIDVGIDMRERTSNLVFSAIIRLNPIPTPSITASKHAHPIAEFSADFRPPRIANDPPVRNPAITKLKEGC